MLEKYGNPLDPFIGGKDEDKHDLLKGGEGEEEKETLIKRDRIEEHPV